MTISGASSSRWARRYAVRLLATDLLVVVLTVVGSQVLWFRDLSSRLVFSEFDLRVAYTTVSVVVIALWMLSLALYATRDHKIIGSGSLEYKRIVDATLRFFGLTAIAAYLLKVELARGYFLTALPVGLFLLLVFRWSWRQWLIRQRRRGGFSSRVLLVGSRASATHFATTIRREPAAGLVVVAALVNGGTPGDELAGVEVLGDLDDVASTLDRVEVDTIVLTSSDRLPPRLVRQLSWDLESRGVNLVVAPALTDVAGPRIHARPVAGLPLIHVEFPSFEGTKHVAKRAFDVLSSVLLLVVLSPVLLWIAIAVRRDSEGPALFRQERVGLGGRPFSMLKFRSMVVNAEEQLPTLLDQSEGNGVLFKMKEDPRVTRVGRFLRKHSLDELPQLVNVLRGDMALVGPRPPLASEVANYDDAASRRLLVKPGITGLWQTSGRSRLSWEDSVRLDLYYVENWSLTGDLVILYRTIRAVARADGAY